MSPKTPSLMDMMPDLDIIDLEDFSAAPKEGEGEKPPVGDPSPPDSTTPEMQNLLKVVADLKETFEKGQETPPEPPPPEPSPAVLPEAPTDEEINEAFTAGETMKGVALMQKQFSINNFVPAMKELATNLQSQTKKTEAGTSTALAHAAAQAIKDAVYDDPALVAVKDQIFGKFRGASPEAIMMPGVIQNVIQQTVGELAMKGEWIGTTDAPANIPEGNTGPTGVDLDPNMREVFRRLTGDTKVDDEMIAALSRPHQINLGTGEG